MGGKAVALIEFLPGVSIDRPEVEQAHSVGRALAGIHLASVDFTMERPNDLGPPAWADTGRKLRREGLARIDPSLPALVAEELEFLADHWPDGLPRSVIHADLFPDNVLMLGNKVSGLIDFYFACNDITAYDLAVTHAAWCFDAEGRGFRPEIGTALVEGYESVRPLSHEEHSALPVLARGAATALHDDPRGGLAQHARRCAGDEEGPDGVCPAARLLCRSRRRERSAAHPPRMSRVEIFTDGACKGNPGPGGWGALLRNGQDREGTLGRRDGDHQQPHGNDRGDPRSAGADPAVRSRALFDSKYVIDGITKWIFGWQKRGWNNAAKQPVAQRGPVARNARGRQAATQSHGTG